MLERLMIFLINIFCPPVSVMIVAGPGMDCIINAILFIAGVIPGHIHGFYVTCTYFYRKRKVRKGRYPGGKKAFIFSEQVWNGGASNDKVRDLLREQKRREQEEEDIRLMKRSSKRSSGLGGMGSRANTGLVGEGRSVRRSNVVMYDGEERRPVERIASVHVKPMREVGGWRR
ncbi:hypothetical protein N431DRAFT_467480 [Stipitochalara longipes BDJ]|nr:hypothetical protein N431DRAFT_467480 [Stipitochalara longipes BDJ]